jgi:ISXO2-like transposase domain
MTRLNTVRKNMFTTATALSAPVEGYYSIFKRGMKGVYEHCTEKHLHRYLAEFDIAIASGSA